MKVSVVMITLNAERTVAQALGSTAFAEETVVVDCGSTDRTLELCGRLGARVISHPWSGYGAQKNFAIGQARGPWILSLDADEVVSPRLAQAIESLDESTAFQGFRLARLNYYFGRPLRHGGQYPDWQLRLFRKTGGRFNERPVHESVSVAGPVGRLPGDLLHYSYPTLDDYFSRFARYTELDAARLLESGARPGPAGVLRWMILRPAWKFLWRYLLKLGFLDGVPGLLAALFNSFTMIVSYARFREKYFAHTPGAQ
jgi:glycosyltransferase involved in cell wall biosynthesis